ncbi:hypothetical protein DY000_02015579 [Brassica cretica]|uniref:Uncharacterized protein n=1 Tax=Brassica cretica TaxID=69181 RepID=A0ABQ7CSE1_BRACR|nr:hypothetical protein DY000_02015579 [Brassica cretica]
MLSPRLSCRRVRTHHITRDAPQYMDQYMEPVQDGAQDDQIIPSKSDHSFSLLVRLIRAECPNERIDGSAGQYDQFLNFDDQNFSKAWILQLSKDLGRAGTKLAHEPYPADCLDRTASVLLLTAKEPLGLDEPGRQPKSHL